MYIRGLASTIVLAAGLILPVSLSPSPARAQQQLASFTEGPLEYELREEPNQFRLLIRPKGGMGSLSEDLTANVFALSRPSRLVVDVPHFMAKTARTVSIKNSDLSAIRVGVHSDKTRLVIDVQGEKAPSYNIHSDAALGALIVDFGLGEIAAAPAGSDRLTADKSNGKPELPEILDNVPEVPPDTVAPAVPDEGTPPLTLPEKAPTPQNKMPPAKNPIKNNDAKTDLPPESTEIITNDNGIITGTAAGTPESRQPSNALPAQDQTGGTIGSSISTVKGVFYQSSKSSQGSSVVIDVDSLNTYSLSQKDANAYELILEKARLGGEHLTLPQFPPDTFKGFEVLLASQRADNVIIKIYVEDGVKLTPFIQKGQLWLRAGQ